MNDFKTTSFSSIAKSDMKKTRTNSRGKKIKKTAHDRPAIFIEDTKDSKYFNLKK